MIAFLLYLNQFFSPIQQLSQVLDTWQQATVSVEKIEELLDTPGGTPAPADPLPVGRLRGEVRLEDVHFAYAGTLAWTVVSGALSKSASSLVGNAALVSKVFFPRLLLPLSVLGSTLLDFGIALGVMAVLLGVGGVTPGAGVVLLPVWLVLGLLLAMGLGFLASSLTVRYRDVQYVLPVAVQFALFASPVAYALDEEPGFPAALAAELQQKRDLLCAGLADVGLGVRAPEGTYFATTDISALGWPDGQSFCMALPERAGVVAIPTQGFYDSAAGRHLVRWAFCKEPGVIEEGLRRLAGADLSA